MKTRPKRRLSARVNLEDNMIPAFQQRAGRLAIGATLFSLSLAATNAFADGATVSTNGGLKVASDDGRFEVGIGGRIQLDGAAFDNDDRGTDNVGGSELRRLRFALSGRVDEWHYLMDFDLANNGVNGQGINLSRKLGGGTLTIGQFKPMFSFEDTTNDLYVNMQERAFVENVLAPGYQIGVGYHGSSGRLIYGASAYNLDKSDSDHAEGFGAAGRLVWLAVDRPRQVLHLGADSAYEQYGQNSDGTHPGVSVSVKGAGHLSNSTTLIDIGDGYNTDVAKYDLEMVWVQGPAYLQGEWGGAHYEAGPSDADLRTWYASAGWFLTGESRPYDRKNGRFGRIDPASDTGAWELAARYDVARGDMHSIDTQVSTSTVGVNWYPNSYLRCTLDFWHSETEDKNTGATEDRTNAVTGRFQIAF